jgi:hypothetical protein
LNLFGLIFDRIILLAQLGDLVLEAFLLLDNGSHIFGRDPTGRASSDIVRKAIVPISDLRRIGCRAAWALDQISTSTAWNAPCPRIHSNAHAGAARSARNGNHLAHRINSLIQTRPNWEIASIH